MVLEMEIPNLSRILVYQNAYVDTSSDECVSK